MLSQTQTWKDTAESEASVATAEQHDNENQGIAFTVMSLCLCSGGETHLNKPNPGVSR